MIRRLSGNDHDRDCAVRALTAGCSDSSSCQLAAGAYRLGAGTLLPGLEVIVPAGWSSTERTPGELNSSRPGSRMTR